jgi:hypothetical protein
MIKNYFKIYNNLIMIIFSKHLIMKNRKKYLESSFDIYYLKKII